MREDADRALDIAFQIGASKAIRNVTVNALQTFADFAFEEAKDVLIEKVGRRLDDYRGRVLARFAERSVDVARVEAVIGRTAPEWLAPDVARIIAMLKAVTDGMAGLDETFPPLTKGPDVPVEGKVAAGSLDGFARSAGAPGPTEPAPAGQMCETDPAGGASGLASGTPPGGQPGGGRPAPAARLDEFHHKTGESVEMPLFDVDGQTALWPELMERLDRAPRRGTLIVIRDQPDRRRKVHLPWQLDYFRHRVAEVREAAGIDPAVKFMGLRHGGNVEGANADLTDAQLRALSGHLTTAALLRYAQATPPQRRDAARKRLAARTGKGTMSE